MNSIQALANTARLGSRQMSSVASSKLTPQLAKIKARQEFFQTADGNMVHEKTSGDKMLFYLTSAGVVAGMGMTFKFYYDFSFPKKG